MIDQIKTALSTTIHKVYTNLTASQKNSLNKILNHNSWWLLIYNSINFTFNDLIKGVIPSELSDNIQCITNNKSATLEILSIVLNKLYTLANRFWKDCCLKVLREKKCQNISSSQKKTISHNANNFHQLDYVDYDIYNHLADQIEGDTILDHVVTFNSHFTNF